MESKNLSETRIAGSQKVLNDIDIGFCIINGQRKITWLNKIIESWMGAGKELIGKECSACFRCNGGKCEICPIGKAFKDKKSHTSDLMVGLATNGEKRYYRITAAPILDNQGNIEEVLESVIDITEKRKRDIKSRRCSAETRKLTKEVIKVDKTYRKLASRRSAKLKLANRELKNIYKLENRLITSLDVKDVMHSIVNIVPKLLKVSGCIVRLIDEGRITLRLEAASGVSNEFQEEARLISAGEGISGRVAKTGSHIAISDILKDKRLKYYRECTKEGMRSLLATPIIFKNNILGVIIAFSRKVKHFNKSEINLLSTFAVHAAIALNNATLHNKVHLNYYNTMISLVKAMEARDPYTCGHSERVTNYAVKIAKRLNLNKEDMQLLLYAGKLHDIGKIAIPDFILKKTAALTMTEKAVIEAHPAKGIEMILHLKFLEKCLPLIRHHHERYDGGGYPDRLEGKMIPLLARILSIADAFDAMTSERPYRKALLSNEAIEEIKRNCSSQFDPQLAKIFLEILQEQPGPKRTEEISAHPADLAS